MLEICKFYNKVPKSKKNENENLLEKILAVVTASTVSYVSKKSKYIHKTNNSKLK